MSNEIENEQQNDRHHRKPVLVFGILTDVQYGKIDDMVIYGRTRFYRNGINLMRRAVDDWRNAPATHGQPLAFILQLGDLIEGWRVFDKAEMIENVYALIAELNVLFGDDQSPQQVPKVLHIYGNHDCQGLGRRFLTASPLNTSRLIADQRNEAKEPSDLTNYYYVDICDKLRLICIDQYEVCSLGYEKSDEVYEESMKLMSHYTELRAQTTCERERDYYERFVTMYGGATSERQMEWLRQRLDECARQNRRAIVAGHIPILRECGSSHIGWNSDALLECMWSFGSTVLVYLSGHYHWGAHELDKHGIHHLVVPAILETPGDSNSYVTVKVFEDAIEFDSKNRLESFSVPF